MTDGMFTFTNNLAELAPKPESGFKTQVVHQDEALKAILIGFADGAEMAEHSSPYPAVLQVLTGHLTITLGEEKHEAEPGAFITMKGGLPHGLLAHEPSAVLLMILKPHRPGDE